jgi:hypothetical protein
MPRIGARDIRPNGMLHGLPSFWRHFMREARKTRNALFSAARISIGRRLDVLRPRTRIDALKVLPSRRCGDSGILSIDSLAHAWDSLDSPRTLSMHTQSEPRMPFSRSARIPVANPALNWTISTECLWVHRSGRKECAPARGRSHRRILLANTSSVPTGSPRASSPASKIVRDCECS